MARWKAHVDFLLSVVELLFLSLMVEALQRKMCQNSLPSGGGRSLGAKISGGRGRPWIMFWFHNTGVCQTHGQTDGQTNGIAVADTALAMRAVKIGVHFYSARNARIASAVLATAIPSVRLSVCLSVRPSHAGIVSKRRHVARCSLHRWIAKCV